MAIDYKPKKELFAKLHPQIKDLVDKILKPHNAKEIYEIMESLNLDSGGYSKLKAAKELTGINIYEHFPTEDNLHYFEEADGNELVKWIEIAKFATNKEYEQLPGGYELLKSHTIDYNSTQYQQYQKGLWYFSVNKVVDSLQFPEAHLLPSLLAELQQFEKESAMTKDTLIDKLDNEIAVLERNTQSFRENGFDRDIVAKTAYRNAIYNTPISDVLIKALLGIEDVLHEMYMTADYDPLDPDNIYDVTHNYLSTLEHETLSDMVYKKADAEFKDFQEMLRTLPPDEIMGKAYEYVMKENILGALENTESQSITDLRAFMAMPNCLGNIYQEWLDNDLSFMDDIRFTIDYAAKEYASEHGIDDEEQSSEIEGESEMEQ